MRTALVIGGGPAGLMAADVLAEAGIRVILCEAKPSIGRKLLMAGKSGLNLTKDEAFDPFMRQYTGASEALRPMIAAFDAGAVQDWARGLGQPVFTGSSGRVFPAAMKASPLLRAWLARLDRLGVHRRVRWRWRGWDGAEAVFETPSGRQTLAADATVLALGGASWARLGSDGAWAETLRGAGCDLARFAPANAALSVKWSHHMRPHFGAALKTVGWRAGNLTSRGEAAISARGLEGGGLYALTPALRQSEALFVDLIPDQPAEKALARLAQKPSKLRLGHWLKNTLRLPEAKTALFFEMTAGALPERAAWVKTIKTLPINYAGLRPMDEAISTAGGVRFAALTPGLMLKARPGVFCAGEMLDWEAPTGGYLLTACLATGRWAGLSAADYLAAAA
ncbi:TIGR03862 family flavoprotein [Roseobacter weihaiensis]|uniref:TIGR03862 family flavoprotein n=1 Tax=Roseobacter weihaiensis TaxID=2763262 RepID=UPI001D0B9B42|nr:TIGR03862 family flavoprotein [Roseobacter sp. H9]